MTVQLTQDFGDGERILQEEVLENLLELGVAQEYIEEMLKRDLIVSTMKSQKMRILL